MMPLWRAFGTTSPYKKQAKFMAMLWTLLVLVACFTPAKEIPNVKIPFIDKWTHFILFGTLAILWLCCDPSVRFKRLLIVGVGCMAFGSLIEVFQGIFVSLGRSCELMDAVADAVGGILGIVIFALIHREVQHILSGN
jgi:VanZ family protein